LKLVGDDEAEEPEERISRRNARDALLHRNGNRPDRLLRAADLADVARLEAELARVADTLKPLREECTSIDDDECCEPRLGNECETRRRLSRIMNRDPIRHER
jgi:hypothetical protein